MELTYSVTADDYWRFSKLLTRKTPTLLLRWVLSFAMLPLFTFYLLWATGAISGSTLFIWLLLCLGWFVFLPWNYKRQSLRRFQQTPGTLGPRSLQISPAALVTSSALIQTRIDWKAIVRVWDSPVGVLFFYSTLHTVLIPTSTFTVTGQRETLVQLGTAYWRHAQFGDPLPELPNAAPDSSIWPPPPRTQIPM